MSENENNNKSADHQNPQAKQQSEKQQDAKQRNYRRRNYRQKNPQQKDAAVQPGNQNDQQDGQKINPSAAGQQAKKQPANDRWKNNPQSQQQATKTQNSVAETSQQEKGKKNYQQGRVSSRKHKDLPNSGIPLRIIPLGGLNEIGKNMTAYECQGDIIIVDCGVAFPDSEMLGVDLVIPDFTYIERNIDRVRGVVLTHGHEDHIGGLPYFLKSFTNVPVYGTRLTLGLVKNKLKEHNLVNKVKMHVVMAGQTIKLGCMSVEFVRVNHSIPDAVALAIQTPAGLVIQTGDFKVDYTPIEGEVIDLARLGELGNKGVLALLCDSTNAERPGYTISERKVGASLSMFFERGRDKRIIVATFASNIHRIQQIADAAILSNRKIAVSGRSMVNVVETARELGYLNIPSDMLVDIAEIGRYPANRIAIITTGSQGEPMAALSRMATGDHRQVNVGEGDLIIISANPIPGNEKLVSRVVNDLMKLGADVIYESMYEVHVSGHACQDEIKMMIGLTKPRYFMPVHGEYKHLKKNAGLGLEMGIPKERIIIGDIGRVIEFNGDKVSDSQMVPAGRVLVDGLGVGDVGSVVLRDRKHLAQDGIIIVVAVLSGETGQIISGPDIVSRGFVYVRESEELMDEVRSAALRALGDLSTGGSREWNNIKARVRDSLSELLYQRTKRSPMILPVIMEV